MRTTACDSALCVRAHVHVHVCVAINSTSHGLACLDLLPGIRDVPDWQYIPRAGRFLEVCLHLILALRVILFNATGWGAPHAPPSYQGTEKKKKKSCLIRFRVTFVISGYKRPARSRSRMCSQHWSFCRPGDREEPDAVKRGRKTTYQKSSDEEITLFEWAALCVEAFRS